MLFNIQKQNERKCELTLVSRLHRKLEEFIAYLGKVLFDDAEVRVWTTLDAQKNLQWHVHNYRTERQGIFYSEVEAIEWIEESYRQLPNMNRKFWFFPGSSTLKVEHPSHTGDR